MGAADLVPGISGGTVAFILGFYEQLLNSIKSINLKNIICLFKKSQDSPSKIEWQFLLTLGSGIVTAILMLASLFHYILQHEILRVYLYSIFFGLIVASFFMCAKHVRKWTLSSVTCLLLGAFIAYLLTGSTLKLDTNQPYAIKINNKFEKIITNYHQEQGLLFNLSASTLQGMLAAGMIDPETSIYDNHGSFLGPFKDIIVYQKQSKIDGWLIFCGAIAICAMLLPGISGSYLLTIFGVYSVIIGALADFLFHLKQFQFDEASFYILLSLLIGIAFGLIYFSRLVSWLINKFPQLSLAMLSGFMIGAIKSIWPFWTYAYTITPLRLEKGPQLQLVEPYFPSLSSPEFILASIIAIISFIAVMWMEFYLARNLPQKHRDTEITKRDFS